MKRAVSDATHRHRPQHGRSRHHRGGVASRAEARRRDHRRRPRAPPGSGNRGTPRAARRMASPSHLPGLQTAVARFRLLPPQHCENDFIIDHIARHSLREVVITEQNLERVEGEANVGSTGLTLEVRQPRFPSELDVGMSHIWRTCAAASRSCAANSASPCRRKPGSTCTSCWTATRRS